MGDHRLAQPHRRRLARVRAVLRRREEGHGAGEAVQGGDEVRGRAAVDGVPRRGFRSDRFERLQARPLHRMIGRDVLGARAEALGEGQKACVLARAVVVGLPRGFARPDQRIAGLAVEGFVGAAAQVAVGQAEIAEPGLHLPCVDRCGGMRGAGEGEPPRRQAEGVGGAALNEGKGLDHLAGAARKDAGRRVAPGLDDFARFVADDGMAEMHALEKPAAPDLGEGDRRAGAAIRFAAAWLHAASRTVRRRLRRPPRHHSAVRRGPHLAAGPGGRPAAKCPLNPAAPWLLSALAGARPGANHWRRKGR